MKQTTLISTVINAINNAQQLKINREELFSSSLAEGKHEFLFFIKPEITLQTERQKLEAILEMIFSRIDVFGLKIKSIILLASAYLEKHDIIARHYGVINALARNAKEKLTGKNIEIFESQFNVKFDESLVYGGIEILKVYPVLTPVSLDYLWQNSPAVKIGSGAYCQALKIDGKSLYLINGFHPRQLEHYTAKGRSIVAFTLSGDIDWSEARNHLIGKTNPADAETGSIRRTLLDNKDSYGMPIVNSSWNGVHLSAGPVESLVELIRYSSDFEAGKLLHPTDYSFGRILSATFNEKNIVEILENQTVMYRGKNESIFDITEEKNSDEAIRILKEVFSNK